MLFRLFRRKDNNTSIEELKKRLLEISKQNMIKDMPKTQTSALRALMSSIDVSNLIRKYESNFVFKQDKRAQAEYLKNIHELKNNEHLLRMVNDLMVEQIREIALNTEDWEATIAGRGTLNGIILVWDTIKGLAVQYETDVLKLNEDQDEDINSNF